MSTGESVLTPRIATIIKTLMVTCGMYDSSGEFAIKVGIPSKKWSRRWNSFSSSRKNGNRYYGPSLDRKEIQ